MKIRVLGCGGSFGSPLAWGRNGNIDINNPHNFRTRSSVLISNNNQNILIDTSPDLREQLYKAKCTKIEIFPLSALCCPPVIGASRTSAFLSNTNLDKYCISCSSVVLISIHK